MSGLEGSGLVLQNNAGDDLPIAKNGSFVFAKALGTGEAFAISVKSYPQGPVQNCTVSGASGVVAAGSVTTVVVDCTITKRTIAGTVSGLVGTGLVLQKNGGGDIVVNSNGAFAFPTVIVGAPYTITVRSQPINPRQACTVTNGTGSALTNVTDIAVTCVTNAYKIGGTVTGLAGAGLQLRLNNGNMLAVGASGAFTFPTPIASGAPFFVTITTQPTNPSQTCQVAGATGTVGSGNVNTVVVNCSFDRFTIGGTVSGALAPLVVQNNGGDDVTLATSGPADTFAFPLTVLSGASYAVTVKSQPGFPSQTCTVANATGTVGSSAVTTVAVSCVTNRFAVRGTVTGLDGTGLKLMTGGEEISVASSGSFAFPTPISSAASYTVTTTGQPSHRSQTCTVSNGSGVVGGSDVTNVLVACVTDTFTIGGTVSGLTGSGLVLRNNGGDARSIAAPGGSFTFATRISSGETFAVTVGTQPTGPSQTCAVSAGSGTVTSGNILGVVVNCAVNSFAVGGAVSGLAGTGLVLQNNLGNNLPINNNGDFAFPPVASGQPYSVTVLTNPALVSQTCAVTNGSGTVAGSAITNVSVVCTTNSYTVGGSVSGLTSGTVTLLNNGGDALARTTNDGFTFATALASGGTYAVTVGTQPAGHTCTVSSGSGTVTGSNVTTVGVSCVQDTPAGFTGNFSAMQGGEAFCPAWNTFRGSLTGVYTRITIQGSNDPTGVTCTGAEADTICQSLRSGTNTSTACGGTTWVVGTCGSGIELTAGGSLCNCSDPGHTVRPCINPRNPNWGGANSNTCNAPSQSLSVTCD